MATIKRPASRTKRSISPITGEEERTNPNGRYSPRSGKAGWQGGGTREDRAMRTARITQHYKRQNPKSYLDQEAGEPVEVKNVGGKQMRVSYYNSNVSRGASVGRQNVGTHKGNVARVPRPKPPVSTPMSAPSVKTGTVRPPRPQARVSAKTIKLGKQPSFIGVKASPLRAAKKNQKKSR